jgi:hypothetical protein
VEKNLGLPAMISHKNDSGNTAAKNCISNININATIANNAYNGKIIRPDNFIRYSLSFSGNRLRKKRNPNEESVTRTRQTGFMFYYLENVFTKRVSNGI